MKQAPLSPEIPRIPVGISACLLGEKVRYDGAHKRSNYCNDVLSQYFDFRPDCQTAIGLGAPLVDHPPGRGA